MKRLNKLIIVGTAVLFFSCDNFLTRIPYNTQAVENSYEREEDIEYAVNGCYNGLIGVKRCSELLFNENRSDNAHYPNTDNIGANADAYFPSLLMVPVGSDYVEPYWRQSYVLINRVNLVLKHLNVVKNDEKKRLYEAQVKFLRGWSYFNMVRYFGGVPLLTEPISSGKDVYNTSRSSEERVYEQIVNDLYDSYTLFESVLGFNHLYGQANRWAAKALLGKVYFTIGDFESAERLLEDVYINSKYKLTDKYQDLFVANQAIENTKAKEEVLFPIRFTTGSVGLGNTFSSLSGAPTVSGQGSNIVFWSDDLKRAFEMTSDVTLDSRYAITCGEVPNSTTVGQTYLKRYPPKCVGLLQDTYLTAKLAVANDGELDFLELRFAEVILMLAEIKGGADGLVLLNEVRHRANTKQYLIDDVEVLFGGDVREAVINERRLELAFENNRYFDLCRIGADYATDRLMNFYKTESPYTDVYPTTKVFVDQLIAGGKIDSWRLLLPIPQNEILRSAALKQNPGYSSEVVSVE